MTTYYQFLKSVLADTGMASFDELVLRPDIMATALDEFRAWVISKGVDPDTLNAETSPSAIEFDKLYRLAERRASKTGVPTAATQLKSVIQSGDDYASYLPTLREIVRQEGVPKRKIRAAGIITQKRVWMKLRRLYFQHKKATPSQSTPKDQKLDRIFTDISAGMEPLRMDLNVESVDIARSRGLVTCHGHVHSAPQLPAIPGVIWYLADRLERNKPDLLINIFDLDSVVSLGLFQYAINHFCPTAHPKLLIRYLYNIRHILVPGGAVYVLSGYRSARRWVDRYELTEDEAIIRFIELLRRIGGFCGYRELEFQVDGVPVNPLDTTLTASEKWAISFNASAVFYV